MERCPGDPGFLTGRDWLDGCAVSCVREHWERGSGRSGGGGRGELRAGKITRSFWEDTDGTSRVIKSKDLEQAFRDVLPLVARQRKVRKHSPSQTAL